MIGGGDVEFCRRAKAIRAVVGRKKLSDRLPTQHTPRNEKLGPATREGKNRQSKSDGGIVYIIPFPFCFQHTHTLPPPTTKHKKKNYLSRDTRWMAADHSMRCLERLSFRRSALRPSSPSPA